jgi:hypothetical protein
MKRSRRTIRRRRRNPGLVEDIGAGVWEVVGWSAIGLTSIFGILASTTVIGGSSGLIPGLNDRIDRSTNDWGMISLITVGSGVTATMVHDYATGEHSSWLPGIIIGGVAFTVVGFGKALASI